MASAQQMKSLAHQAVAAAERKSATAELERAEGHEKKESAQMHQIKGNRELQLMEKDILNELDQFETMLRENQMTERAMKQRPRVKHRLESLQKRLEEFFDC